MRLGLGLIAALAVPVVATAPADASAVVALSTLDGAVVPERFVLTVDLAGATSAKLVVDGTYAGEDDEPPLQFAIDLSAGEHRAVVRAIVDVARRSRQRGARREPVHGQRRRADPDRAVGAADHRGDHQRRRRARRHDPRSTP